MKNKTASDYTDVVFRRFFGSNEIIALFPAVPADNCLAHCMSYQHIGQHGAASADLSDRTCLAMPHEFLPLKRELETIGYNLNVCKRISRKHTSARHSAIAAYRHGRT